MEAHHINAVPGEPYPTPFTVPEGISMVTALGPGSSSVIALAVATPQRRVVSLTILSDTAGISGERVHISFRATGELAGLRVLVLGDQDPNSTVPVVLTITGMVNLVERVNAMALRTQE
jgi:hypothetical protein